MALNENKVQSLQDNINSLEVQNGLSTTVNSVQKDIFNLFKEPTIRVSEKKQIIKLEQGLIESRDRMNKSIESHSKNDKDSINGIKVGKAKKHIKKISAQIYFIANIKKSINQINDPATITQSFVSLKQTETKLFSQDVVQNDTDVYIDLVEKGSCVKHDKDRNSIKISAIGTDKKTRQIMTPEEDILGHIMKKNDGWITTFHPGQVEKIQKLGIKELQIPFNIRKSISLIDPDTDTVNKNFVEKTKRRKINLEQLQTGSATMPEEKPVTIPEETPTPASEEVPAQTPEKTLDPILEEKPDPVIDKKPKPLELPPHTPENPIDTIDQKMEQLFKLVNMSDMRMQYTNLKTRWDVLKIHMQDFDKNQSINADTPLFRSIFPALEQEINEFKKQLTNAIIDTQDKIDLVKNSGIADLAKVKQLQQEIEDIKAKYKSIDDEFATIHKDLFARIYKKTPKELPPHIPTEEIPPVDMPPADETPENNGPAGKLEISAHVMDKESLVKKSIEQDVLEEYQHKYEKRRRPKRLAMYTFARWRQDNRINNRLSISKKHNAAIETDITRQQRIASSIGNFASEYDLGLDAGKVKKTSLGSNDAVNNIANNYIKGADKGGISREDAISQFNDFFTNNKDYQTGMTGSDIMEQLDDIRFMVAIKDNIKTAKTRTDDDYEKIQDEIYKLFGDHPTAQLHGIHFNNPNVASKAEMDKLCDHIIAYKSKSAVKQLNNITANVKLYKVEKDTVELTQSKLREHNRSWVDKVFSVANTATFGLAGSTIGSAALKVGAGMGLAAGGFGTLGVVGGVAGLAAALQWMKTYRDYLTEAQKTHEDAITMGTVELDRRIKELEEQVKKHSAMQKTLAWRGFGKHAIRTKQLNILKAVNDKMYKTGAMKPAITLITAMQDPNKDKQALAIAETLARLKAGRELDTNFISGTNRGLTEQERKSLLIQLRDSAAKRATEVGYGHLVPPRNANEEKWRMFRARLIAIPQNNIGAIYQKQYTELKKNFVGMKDDISAGRKKMARRDAGSNLLTSATVAGVAAGATAIGRGMGWTSGTSGTTSSGPHNEYSLGQYEHAVTDKASGRETAFNNGDKVSFQGESAVDAVNAAKGSFGDINKEIAEVTKLAGSFDGATQDAVKEALTTELAKVKAEAIKAGADAGNIALTQQRWVDGVEEIVSKLHAAGKTGVTIEDIKFDPSTFNPIDIQASAAAGSGVGMQDVIDRSVAFQATIDGTSGSRNRGDPLWVVWPGFSNTYAKPGDESKHDDSWSKRTEDLDKKDKEEDKKKKKENQERDDYNNDFEKKHKLPGEEPLYTPVPPVTDKDENRKEKWKENRNKPFDPGEGGETPQDYPYGDSDSKRGISPRGREGSRTETDVPRFFEKDYPKTPMILDPQQAAERIIAAKYYNRPLSDMPFIGDPKYSMGAYTPQIEEALRQKNYQKAVSLLAENIAKEQEYVDEQAKKLGFNITIDTSLVTVDEVFDQLGVLDKDRSEIPDKDHIHIIPSYLFHAQSGEYSKNTLGFIQFMDGHVFINYEALLHGPHGNRSPEEQKAVLVHAITHELIHGATTSNYHKTRKEKDGKMIDGTEDYVFLRRMGTQLVRRIDKTGHLKERGRALNEGLTESLNLYILEEKLGMQAAINGYPGERKIVDMLSEKFNLKKTDLYKFLIHRKFGGDLIRKVYGKKEEGNKISYERPGYITLLMEIMDSEHLKYTNGALPLAEKFIQGENLVIKKTDSKKFHPSLINPDGSLKADILTAYPFITQA